MTLTELQTEVIGITNRPDLVSRTLSAVKAATLACHTNDFYSKDVLEALVQFPSATFEQTFNTVATFPRWRAIKYIRAVDSISGIPVEPPLTLITPEEILDGYGYTKLNVFYEAGTNLQIKLKTAYSQFLIGYYALPDTATNTFSSWIAASWPWAIIYEAAAIIFKSIGQSEMETSQRGLSREWMQRIAISNIQAVGY